MIPISSVLRVLSLSQEQLNFCVNVMYISFVIPKLNFISLRNLSFRETLERFINLCTQKNLGEKKRKKSNAQQHPYLKKKRRKKVREKSDVYFFSLSLSLSFSASVTRARARLLWSLSLLRFCLFALLSSERRRKERIKRAFLK